MKRGFLDLLPESGSFDVISKGYQVALARGHKVSAFVHEGVWHDIRNPAYYWLAVKDFLENEAKGKPVGIDACRAARGLESKRQGSVLWDQRSKVSPAAAFRGAVMIEPGSEVGHQSRLENCLLLPGAKVGAGAVEKSVILGENLRVPL